MTSKMVLFISRNDIPRVDVNDRRRFLFEYVGLEECVRIVCGCFLTPNGFSLSLCWQLMKVLSNPNFSHIVEWLPSGNSFVIHKPKAFATDLLPTHFKSAKYSSFTRKLHRWGFVRHFQGGEAGAFFHDNFQKGRLDLAEAMTCCQQQKEAASKSARKVRGAGNVKTQQQQLLQQQQQQVLLSYNKAVPGLGNDSFRHIMSQRAGLSGLQQAQSLRMNPYATSSEIANALQEYSSQPPVGLMPNNLNMMNRPQSSMFPSLRPTNNNSATNLTSSLPMSGVDLHAMNALEQQIMKERLETAIQDELARLEFTRLTKSRISANALNRYQMQQQQQQLQQQQQQQQMQHQQLHRNNLLGLPSSNVALGGVPASSLSPLGASSLAPALSQLSRAELEQYALAMSTRNLHGGGGGQQQQQQQQPTPPQMHHPTNHPIPNLPYNIRGARSNAYLPP
jgi:HSF-type DNA-binding